MEKRRETAYLVETYKVLKGTYEVLDLANMFTRALTEHLKGYQLKFKTGRFCPILRQNFLSNRIVNTWNFPPPEAVNAFKFKAFKYHQIVNTTFLNLFILLYVIWIYYFIEISVLNLYNFVIFSNYITIRFLSVYIIF